MSVSVNAKFNSQFNASVSPILNILQQKVLPVLSTEDLRRLCATSQAFQQIVKQDPRSCLRLDVLARAEEEWASKAVVKIKEDFLDWERPAPEDAGPFTMQTVINLAKWLREKGNTLIPPHGMGTVQHEEKKPFDYINAINPGDRRQIFDNLSKGKELSEGDHGCEEQALSDRGGSRFTDTEVAEALERFVKEDYYKSYHYRSHEIPLKSYLGPDKYKEHKRSTEIFFNGLNAGKKIVQRELNIVQEELNAARKEIQSLKSQLFMQKQNTWKQKEKTSRYKYRAGC